MDVVEHVHFVQQSTPLLGGAGGGYFVNRLPACLRMT
jgi:hypothetical protein